MKKLFIYFSIINAFKKIIYFLDNFLYTYMKILYSYQNNTNMMFDHLFKKSLEIHILMKYYYYYNVYLNILYV